MIGVGLTKTSENKYESFKTQLICFSLFLLNGYRSGHRFSSKNKEIMCFYFRGHHQSLLEFRVIFNLDSTALWLLRCVQCCRGFKFNTREIVQVAVVVEKMVESRFMLFCHMWKRFRFSKFEFLDCDTIWSPCINSKK